MSCWVKPRPRNLLLGPGTISYERAWSSLFLPVSLTTRHQRLFLASPASSLVIFVRVVLVLGASAPWAGGLTTESYCSTLFLEEPSRPKSSRQKMLWLWLVA